MIQTKILNYFLNVFNEFYFVFSLLLKAI